MSSNIVIVDEAKKVRPGVVRSSITKLLKGLNTNTLDLAELLHEAKNEGYFSQWGYDTFRGYLKEIDIKSSRAYYLIRIVEVMKKSNVPRPVYDNIDITKLIAISNLEPEGEFNGKPMPEVINHLTANAGNMDLAGVKAAVAQIQGKDPKDEFVWLNISVKADARDSVIRPALEAAKASIGSVGKDDEGFSKDASDGNALEKICADFLSDPNNNPLGG